MGVVLEDRMLLALAAIGFLYLLRLVYLVVRWCFGSIATSSNLPNLSPGHYPLLLPAQVKFHDVSPILDLLVATDKKVFPKYDVLGWYSTGSDVQDSDMHIHRVVSSEKFEAFHACFKYLLCI